MLFYRIIMTKLPLSAIVVASFVSLSPAQVILESGMISGSSATAAASAGKGTGKALTGVFGRVEKTLKDTGKAQAVATGPAQAVQSPEKPAEEVKLPDVTQIATGMTREDLLAKFGNPSMRMTIPDGPHITERYRYDVAKDSVKVTLEDGKVTEIAEFHGK
jgi:hypothetical protein